MRGRVNFWSRDATILRMVCTLIAIVVPAPVATEVNPSMVTYVLCDGRRHQPPERLYTGPQSHGA